MAVAGSAHSGVWRNLLLLRLTFRLRKDKKQIIDLLKRVRNFPNNVSWV
ncbi:MAG: hypothetical protein DBX55_09025 [Verrucomicrobia bacterium]|nr:MAG: hypothetical protein DBX55_09025 [Verrucomicrobiota bacterium]